MSERVRTPAALARRPAAGNALAGRLAVLLLLALLSAAVTPHAHAVVLPTARVESAAAGSTPLPVALEAVGCLACRVGPDRVGIARGGEVVLSRVAPPVHRLAREGREHLFSMTVRAAARPRAPPA